MAKRFRGSGVKHTLPYLAPFSGLWLVASVAAVLLAAGSTLYLMRATTGNPGYLPLVLVLEVVILLVAFFGLAVFTTHRLAGPWIAVRRALRRVRDGDLETPLRIRRADAHLRAVEEEFNGMISALRRHREPGPGS